MKLQFVDKLHSFFYLHFKQRRFLMHVASVFTKKKEAIIIFEFTTILANYLYPIVVSSCFSFPIYQLLPNGMFSKQ